MNQTPVWKVKYCQENTMIVLPSTNLMYQYDEISERCTRTGEPVFLTANGKVDLVVLSIETFEKKRSFAEFEGAPTRY